ncbi:NB-ARC domains-containing protein, partial [Tanacetum coccineum]
LASAAICQKWGCYISSVGEGIMAIKKMMSRKPVLLILDDVDDDDEQLDALAGSRTWFFLRSLIIFTGRDRQMLRSHGVDGIHDMKFLDEDKSLELFYSFAFEGKKSFYRLRRNCCESYEIRARSPFGL